jgi:hypothetical protein
VFERQKGRIRRKLLGVLPPHLLPDERVLVALLATRTDRPLVHLVPVLAVAAFAGWAFTRPEQPVLASLVTFGLVALIVWLLAFARMFASRWLVLTDRRLLILRLDPSKNRLEVERADALRVGSLAARTSSVLGRGFVYRTIGGATFRFRAHSQYLPELEELLAILDPAGSRPDVVEPPPPPPPSPPA